MKMRVVSVKLYKQLRKPPQSANIYADDLLISR